MLSEKKKDALLRECAAFIFLGKNNNIQQKREKLNQYAKARCVIAF